MKNIISRFNLDSHKMGNGCHLGQRRSRKFSGTPETIRANGEADRPAGPRGKTGWNDAGHWWAESAPFRVDTGLSVPGPQTRGAWPFPWGFSKRAVTLPSQHLFYLFYWIRAWEPHIAGRCFVKLQNIIVLSCQENKNILCRHLVSTFESRIHPLRIKTISDVSFLVWKYEKIWLNMKWFFFASAGKSGI